jgi:hypothetical protein
MARTRAIILGSCIAVACGLAAIAWTVARHIAGPARVATREDAPSLPSGPATTATEQQIGGLTWLVPAGWAAEPGARPGSLRVLGPDEARLEVEPRAEGGPEGVRVRVGECLDGRRSSVGPVRVSETLVEVRFEQGPVEWTTRCLFRPRTLLRATAPAEAFEAHDLATWLLLLDISRGWHSAPGAVHG